MAWTIEFDAGAKKDLSRLDPQIARRITAFLRERVASLENPRSMDQALHGSTLGTFWRYRVGDYRVICDLQADRILVLVLRIAHRREVYR
ncbi:MAG TPA: type II toxin-antitoxin system RelE/ParE family toxin [Acidobacteriaceae bacterium]|nr:type II toxin-antitoxin system RelE/ParE family toxin [Acidobacteriaceae bacterium]